MKFPLWEILAVAVVVFALVYSALCIAKAMYPNMFDEYK